MVISSYFNVGFFRLVVMVGKFYFWFGKNMTMCLYFLFSCLMEIYFENKHALISVAFCFLFLMKYFVFGEKKTERERNNTICLWCFWVDMTCWIFLMLFINHDHRDNHRMGIICPVVLDISNTTMVYSNMDLLFSDSSDGMERFSLNHLVHCC